MIFIILGVCSEEGGLVCFIAWLKACTGSLINSQLCMYSLTQHDLLDTYYVPGRIRHWGASDEEGSFYLCSQKACCPVHRKAFLILVRWSNSNTTCLPIRFLPLVLPEAVSSGSTRNDCFLGQLHSLPGLVSWSSGIPLSWCTFSSCWSIIL